MKHLKCKIGAVILAPVAVALFFGLIGLWGYSVYWLEKNAHPLAPLLPVSAPFFPIAWWAIYEYCKKHHGN